MKNKKIIYIGLFFIIIVGIASSIHTIQNKPENIIKNLLKLLKIKMATYYVLFMRPITSVI